MKQLAFLPLLLAPALASLTAAATPAAAPAVAAEPAAAPATLEARLRALLDGIEKAQSGDCYEAARLVLDETGDPTRLYPLMQQAAQNGSAAALVWLAPLELTRLAAAGAVMESDPRALEFRTRVLAAADAGSDYQPLLVLASRLAGLGVGAAEDEKLAMRYLMEACKRGSAQARAGYLLVSGRLQKGGPKAPEVASELGRNNYHLEELIAQGLGDTAEGVEWLKKARSHGSPLAPYLLTQSRAAGLNEADAMACLTESAERHHLDAMAFLGNISLRADDLSAQTGMKLKQDSVGGLRLLQLAAALGHAEAAQGLATTYAQGQAGEGQVPVQQICELFRMAAEMGEPHGLAGYGYCLLTGRGCAADATRGEDLLRKGIEKGAQWGNQALASAYFNGFGMKPDLRRAVNALGEDAAMGSVHAYAIMAGLTALGNEGTPPDLFRARIYLDMAKGSGDTDAQAIYDAILAEKGWRFLQALWK